MQLEWAAEARGVMKRISPFAQKMAKNYIEKKAHESKVQVITKEFIEKATESLPFMKKSDQ